MCKRYSTIIYFLFADVDGEQNTVQNVPSKKVSSTAKTKKQQKQSKQKSAKQWTEDTSYFENLNIDFSEEPKLFLSAPGITKEIDYFLEIFDDTLFSLIVDQTNLYAQQKPVRNWVPLTVQELKSYIGCLILMGIHPLPRLENYWSSDPLLGYKGVYEVMNSKKFKKITEALHCNDNTQCPPRDSPDYDKLYKLRPVIDFLNEKLSNIYKSSSCVSIDESMIPFKGRSSIKQYMPMKPVKRGYKVWCLADSKTGFLSKFQIYTGKEKNTCDIQNSLGERVVLKLTEHLEGRNCLAVFDNFFTSLALLEKLREKQIYAIGTVRKDRMDLPDIMKKK